MAAERTANAEQAALLLDPKLDAMLSRLSEGPVGAADLARHLHRPLSTVYATLQRFVAAGLVEQVSERRRAGRSVREFQLILPWNVPFEVTPAATLRELLGGGFQARIHAQLDGLATFMGRLSGEWMVEIGTPDGLWQHHTRQRERVPGSALPVFAQGRDLTLTDDQAHEFEQRLKALIDEFETPPSPGSRTWLMTALFTPNP
jgi:DNA-binding transcriptional ArsR family regulator